MHPIYWSVAIVLYSISIYQLRVFVSFHWRQNSSLIRQVLRKRKKIQARSVLIKLFSEKLSMIFWKKPRKKNSKVTHVIFLSRANKFISTDHEAKHELTGRDKNLPNFDWKVLYILIVNRLYLAQHFSLVRLKIVKIKIGINYRQHFIDINGVY